MRTAVKLIVAIVVVGSSGALLTAVARAQENYKTADAAFRAGAEALRGRDFAGSQKPLEAALKLAPDDKYRLKVYSALLPAYRLLPETEKMQEAVEFLLRHSTSVPEKSLVRRGYLSFLYQRGKIDPATERYEAELKQKPNDEVLLTLLSEIYAGPKPNPARSAELTERLAKLVEKEGKPLDVANTAQLAMQYVRAKKFKEGAELYEKIAPLDDKLSAWHWKEAALAWIQVGDKKRALAAAAASAASTPEARSEQLEYFWRRALGDVFLGAGEPVLAIPHFQQALTKTKIDGYLQDTQKKLTEAETLAAKN